MTRFLRTRRRHVQRLAALAVVAIAVSGTAMTTAGPCGASGLARQAQPGGNVHLAAGQSTSRRRLVFRQSPEVRPAAADAGDAAGEQVRDDEDDEPADGVEEVVVAGRHDRVHGDGRIEHGEDPDDVAARPSGRRRTQPRSPTRSAGSAWRQTGSTPSASLRRQPSRTSGVRSACRRIRTDDRRPTRRGDAAASAGRKREADQPEDGHEAQGVAPQQVGVGPRGYNHTRVPNVMGR